MATLTGRSVSSSYPELLKLNASGMTENLATIEDGAGVASPVQLSSTRVAITSAATAGFSVAAPASFSGATLFTSAASFTGGATFSSLTLSALGTSSYPINNAFFGYAEVNLDGANNSGGIFNKVTLQNSTVSSLAVDLAVADGGTGASTFTSKGVLFGNGSSAIQATAAGTNGQILVANATGTPVFSTRSPVLTVTGDATGTATFTDLGNATLNLTIPAGQITDADITGPISESKIPTLSTAGKVSGSAITSGTIAGNTAVNTTGAISSGAITTSAGVQATGNISGAQGSFSSLEIRGTNRTFAFPTVDGNAGQVLATNGAGIVSWVASGGGGGGGGGGLSSVSSDPAPLLGGNLNVGGYAIVSSSNGNISITPNGTGTTLISKVATPVTSTDAANKGYVDSAITTAAATAQYNASQIRGINVHTVTPTIDGQVLAYNLTNNRYEASAVNTSGFWGFRVNGDRLVADYGSGSFTLSNYFDSIFAPFSSVTLDSNGHVVATF